MFLPEIPLARVRYRDQATRLPRSGKVILAQYDEQSIVVYQAYKLSIARHGVMTGTLGGDEFSFGRMSWIKPNFLWMMYRSGWGTKRDQEATLGLRIRRTFFDEILTVAVASAYQPERYRTREAWQAAMACSEVRLQWDPDHDEQGRKLSRRALQLGLRGEMLRRLATVELVEVIDLTEFVAEQRARLVDRPDRLVTPIERLYWPDRMDAAENIGLREATYARAREEAADWERLLNLPTAE